MAISTSGLLVGRLGLGFPLGGPKRMNGIAQGDREHHKGSGWLVLLGVATAVTSFTTVMALGLPEAFACSAS